MLIPNAFSIRSAISGDKSALPFSNFEIVGRVTARFFVSSRLAETFVKPTSCDLSLQSQQTEKCCGHCHIQLCAASH